MDELVRMLDDGMFEEVLYVILQLDLLFATVPMVQARTCRKLGAMEVRSLL